MGCDGIRESEQPASHRGIYFTGDIRGESFGNCGFLMPYTSPEAKLITLASANATLQGIFGTLPFRWFFMRLDQKAIQNGVCVRLTRVSTVRPSNMGIIGNLSLVRLQIDVMSTDAVAALDAANAVIDFLSTISLCWPTTDQANARQNPCFLTDQTTGSIPDPQPEVFYERLTYRIYNREDLN